jgi:hypothetical protein
MGATEIFYGDWIVEVGGFWTPDTIPQVGQRFIITGGATGNGVYPVEIGVPLRPLAVSGSEWSISFETGNDQSGWKPNEDVLRLSAVYTLKYGLVEILGTPGDWNSTDHMFHHPFAIQVSLRNVDPKINPWSPFVSRLTFSISKQLPPKEPISKKGPIE